MVVDDVAYAVASACVITVGYIHCSTAEAHVSYDDIVCVDKHCLACHYDTIARGCLSGYRDVWGEDVYRPLELYLACHIEHDDTRTACLTRLTERAGTAVGKRCDNIHSRLDWRAEIVHSTAAERVHAASLCTGEGWYGGLLEVGGAGCLWHERLACQHAIYDIGQGFAP